MLKDELSLNFFLPSTKLQRARNVWIERLKKRQRGEQRTKGDSERQQWSLGMTEWEHWRHRWQRLTAILLSLTSTVHHRSSPLNIKTGQGLEEVRGRKEFSPKLEICCQRKQADILSQTPHNHRDFLWPFTPHTQIHRTTHIYVISLR